MRVGGGRERGRKKEGRVIRKHLRTYACRRREREGGERRKGESYNGPCLSIPCLIASFPLSDFSPPQAPVSITPSWVCEANSSPQSASAVHAAI